MTATTTTESTVKSCGLAALEFSRGFLEQLADGIPPDKATHQPVNTANHLLWILGHSAVTDDYFISTLAGQEAKCPENWGELFGMGSEPVDDPSKYPALDEVKTVMAERREALVAWLGSLDDDALAEPLPEDLQGFAANRGALMATLAAHEAMHVGQLSVIRKSLGLPRVMG